jgi:MOSC domain-containing protein YiiM
MAILPKESHLNTLMAQFAQVGKVTFIGIRPASRQPVMAVTDTFAHIGTGLSGDRYKGTAESKRQVTLIQAEHLQAVASFLGQKELDPALVRRNIVVKGINLLALKDKKFRIGEAILEMTGLCHPCSRMEEILGKGGYNAMRGHGGITCRVLTEGAIKIGDVVAVLVEE